MVTGNEVSARWVVGRLLEVSQRAEIRSLSPHLPNRTFLAQWKAGKNGDRQRSFRAVGGRAFAGSFSGRGNSKPVTTFAESNISGTVQAWQKW
jgi:hypothetical protein